MKATPDTVQLDVCCGCSAIMPASEIEAHTRGSECLAALGHAALCARQGELF